MASSVLAFSFKVSKRTHRHLVILRRWCTRGHSCVHHCHPDVSRHNGASVRAMECSGMASSTADTRHAGRGHRERKDDRACPM